MLYSELLGTLRVRPRGRRPSLLRRCPEDTTDLLDKANALRLTRIEEAISFLRAVRNKYANLPLLVSWFGGKDSTVASFLTERTFGNERITYVFADTTRELRHTHEFLPHFGTLMIASFSLVRVCRQSFFDFCGQIGPPSSVQRWCCTTQKTAVLVQVLNSIAPHTKVLCVTGWRAEEAGRR